MQNLSKNVSCIWHMGATVAGTSVITAAAGIDTQTFDGIMFIALFGALSASQVTTLEARGCATLGGSYAAFTTPAITAAMADADSSKILVLDIFRPQTRFVKAIINRATGNAVINGCLAILYNGDKMPFSLDATVSKLATFVSP